ncbi:hypothetical protein QMK17_02225 [Rhodococcus sp. G-MC3]|uniref:hypothetical protein n=1 Tax=Rhodococcus sp. G-MC3 TaxID=3046209 RepID=UPI0024B8814F|nr:hypothetical protein [Rhodococcus sp. G-MC3]MDJ0392149.1 hypothetical protein [Rhodococcus sp. G-MC3]
MSKWVLAGLAAVCGFALVTFGNVVTSAVLAALVVLFVLGLSTTATRRSRRCSAVPNIAATQARRGWPPVDHSCELRPLVTLPLPGGRSATSH